jgi:N-acetylglucosaminyldiphosphoundecaprenol N-acetyl-beta-D-mannosaminyltransferase
VTLPRRGNILGVGVSLTDYAQAATLIIDAATRRRALLVTAADVHMIIQARRDPDYAAVLNDFDLVTPDGQPLRWGLRWTHQAQLAERVYGPTLMLHVCEAAVRANLPIFLYGGLARTLERLSQSLRGRFPALRVAGTRAGRFRALTPAEQDADAAEITASGAAIVFVGMGCPRQEWWMFHMRDRIAAPMLGVGAAFDFHAGLVQQAPPWMQARGLEWAYRLAREPRRLWRRYLLLTPRFIPLIAVQVTGLRKFPYARDLAAAEHRDCPG